MSTNYTVSIRFQVQAVLLATMPRSSLPNGCRNPSPALGVKF